MHPVKRARLSSTGMNKSRRNEHKDFMAKFDRVPAWITERRNELVKRFLESQQASIYGSSAWIRNLIDYLGEPDQNSVTEEDVKIWMAESDLFKMAAIRQGIASFRNSRDSSNLSPPKAINSEAPAPHEKVVEANAEEATGGCMDDSGSLAQSSLEGPSQEKCQGHSSYSAQDSPSPSTSPASSSEIKEEMQLDPVQSLPIETLDSDKIVGIIWKMGSLDLSSSEEEPEDSSPMDNENFNCQC